MAYIKKIKINDTKYDVAMVNSLTFNSSGSGASSGNTFNGEASKTISYNTIGAVPATRTINGKPLSSNISIAANDIDAYTKAQTDTAIYNAIGAAMAAAY